MIKFYCFFWVLALGVSQTKSELTALVWLQGEWQATSGEKIVYESWTQVSSKTFEGLGKTVFNKNTQSETLRIVEMSGELFFIANVSHNPFPVAFKCVKLTTESVVFENFTHDFPKRIQYLKNGENEFKAIVSDAANKRFELSFKRVRNK